MVVPFFLNYPINPFIYYKLSSLSQATTEQLYQTYFPFRSASKDKNRGALAPSSTVKDPL